MSWCQRTAARPELPPVMRRPWSSATCSVSCNAALTKRSPSNALLPEEAMALAITRQAATAVGLETAAGMAMAMAIAVGSRHPHLHSPAHSPAATEVSNFFQVCSGPQEMGLLSACPALQCLAMPCHCYIMPCFALRGHTLPSHTRPCHAVPCHPCFAMSSQVLPCNALQSAAMPCLAMHCDADPALCVVPLSLVENRIMAPYTFGLP